MNPLTHDEGALLYHVSMWGAPGYPIAKLRKGRTPKWIIGPWRSWTGFPTVYATKKAAVAQFERWYDMALERWTAMKQANPNITLTAIGVRDEHGN